MKLQTSVPTDHADKNKKVFVHFECAGLVAESIVVLFSLSAYYVLCSEGIVVFSEEPCNWKSPELSAP